MALKHKKKILEILENPNHEYYDLVKDLDNNIDYQLNTNRKYYSSSASLDWENGEIVWTFYDDTTQIEEGILEQINMTDDRVYYYSLEKNSYKKHQTQMKKELFKICEIEHNKDIEELKIWTKNFKKTFKIELREKKIKNISKNLDNNK